MGLWNWRILVIGLMIVTSSLPAADGPTPYPDAKDEKAWPGVGPIRTFGWMVDNRAHFWKQRDKDQGAVVFAGDSLTGNWEGKKLAAAFPKLKVANRGIGGDVSRGLLFRFQEDVLDLKPRAIVICIGSNDLSAHADPKGIEKNIITILDKANADNPQRLIVLCTIPPRDHKDAPTKPGAQADINARIKKTGRSSRERHDRRPLHADERFRRQVRGQVLHQGPPAFLTRRLRPLGRSPRAGFRQARPQIVRLPKEYDGGRSKVTASSSRFGALARDHEKSHFSFLTSFFN
jgi:hypothetical protein